MKTGTIVSKSKVKRKKSFIKYTEKIINSDKTLKWYVSKYYPDEEDYYQKPRKYDIYYGDQVVIRLSHNKRKYITQTKIRAFDVNSNDTFNLIRRSLYVQNFLGTYVRKLSDVVKIKDGFFKTTQDKLNFNLIGKEAEIDEYFYPMGLSNFI